MINGCHWMSTLNHLARGSMQLEVQIFDVWLDQRIRINASGFGS